VNRFSQAAQDYLRTIPTIVLERVNAELELVPTVHFTTATYGIHRSGTAYRMDEIPVRLRPLIDSNLPTDGDVLRAIQAALV
jgi:formylmethanofuran dehydrogenase subunit B